MAVMIRLLLYVVLVFSSFAEAQEKLTTTPDPLALEANWWSYFETTEPINKQEMDDRIEKSRERLEKTLLGITVDQQTSLTPLTKKIYDELRQFSTLKHAVAEDNITPLLQSEQLTIDQALERFRLWRRLKRESDLEHEDLAWQNAQLSLERKRQSQRRNNYLQLPATDPARLPQGLALMASRVSLELATLQTKRRSSKLKNTGVQLQNLKEDFETIDEHLVSSPDVQNNWQKAQANAITKAENLRQQVDTPLDNSSPDTALGSANIKRLLLLATERDVQISTHELLALRFRMMDALNQALANTEKTQTINKHLGEIVEEFLDFKDTLEEQLQLWRSSTEQTRKFASAQALNIEATDKALAQIYAKLLKQADENERWLGNFKLELDTSMFVRQLAQSRLKADAGWLNNWLTTSGSWLEISWETVGEWLNTTLFEISETPVTTAGLLRVLIIISFALFLSRLLRRGLEKLGQKKHGVSDSALYTLGRVIHYIILVVGIIIGLSSIGIDFTKFALFASALGVGIGFGLQTLISNFVAGLIILFERSLKVGDFVELASGLTGEVREINMRSTLITTNDNIDILVPNSEFMNGQLTNWTLRDARRRIHIPFGVAYGTDKDLVRKAVLEAADEVEWTLKNASHFAPQVWFVEFGDSSLNFELVVWLSPQAVKRPGAVHAAYLWEIDTKLREYGIEVPFPQRDLHLRSVFGQKEEAGLEFINKPGK